jgi:hypothetical protein
MPVNHFLKDKKRKCQTFRVKAGRKIVLRIRNRSTCDGRMVHAISYRGHMATVKIFNLSESIMKERAFLKVCIVTVVP